MPNNPRERIVAGAADMLARGGLARTSVRELARHADTPLGSTYHYFPEGKPQLAREAVEYAGESISTMLETALQDGPVDGLRSLLAVTRTMLIDSEFEAGCPVFSVAVTESRSGSTQGAVDAAKESFSRWERALRVSLVEAGVDNDDAEGIAALTVCSFEGAVGVCRAEGSTRALDTVEDFLTGLITHALPPADQR